MHQYIHVRIDRHLPRYSGKRQIPTFLLSDTGWGGQKSTLRARRHWFLSRKMDFGRFPAASSHSHGMRSASGLRLGAKSRPRGWPDRLLEEYQSQNEKNMVPEGFELALSTLRRCNLTVKTQVFLNIFTLSLLSVLPIMLSRGGSNKSFKISF